MPSITYREARLEDIPRLQVIRGAVKENILSDPALVTFHDYEDYLTARGKGWVGCVDGQIAGFAIADLQEHNVWALFVEPGFEGLGLGKQLHHLLLDWYFSQTEETIWLSTGFHTRAEEFYRRQGWTETGLYGSEETRFEMHHDYWKSKRATEDPPVAQHLS